MDSLVANRLHAFCERLNLPLATADELVTFLTVQTLVGEERARDLSPSSKLDELLHAVLLNTDVRKIVEKLVGEIHHSEVAAELAEELKAERR